ncbi:MAG: hypothetical protein Tsb0021_07800 [Chlamydiales bacterium]
MIMRNTNFFLVFNKTSLLSFLLLLANGQSFAQDPMQDTSPWEGTDYTYQFFNMLLTLGLIIGLLLIITWFFKKMMYSRIQQMNQTSEIKILESRAVSTKMSVHLLEVHNKQILFAESASGLLHLGDFPAQKSSRTFEEVLDETDSKKNN